MKLQSTREFARNHGAKIGAFLLALPVLAQAQTDPFTTAAADITTKIGTYGAALVAVSGVGVIFMVAMKYVKKLPRAA